VNTDSSKKCTQSNAYNWKGVMDFIKEEVKTSTNEWSHEKLMLIVILLIFIFRKKLMI
jgi:hypothetical protein